MPTTRRANGTNGTSGTSGISRSDWLYGDAGRPWLTRIARSLGSDWASRPGGIIGSDWSDGTDRPSGSDRPDRECGRRQLRGDHADADHLFHPPLTQG